MDKKSRKRDIADIITGARTAGDRVLSEPTAKEILRLASIPVPVFRVVDDMEGAGNAAEEIGFPVVLKVISRDILHKSEVHGVAAGINSRRELDARFAQMALDVADSEPLASIEGFLVEQMVPRGVEIVVGALRDEQFGATVMFGIGGVAVELMKDVSFRLAPVSRDEAFAMMAEVKGYPLITGFRGDAPKDLGAIADVIVRLSQIMEDANDLKEFEINPLIVLDHGAVAVDARAVLA